MKSLKLLAFLAVIEFSDCQRVVGVFLVFLLCFADVRLVPAFLRDDADHVLECSRYDVVWNFGQMVGNFDDVQRLVMSQHLQVVWVAFKKRFELFRVVHFSFDLLESGLSNSVLRDRPPTVLSSVSERLHLFQLKLMLLHDYVFARVSRQQVFFHQVHQIVLCQRHERENISGIVAASSSTSSVNVRIDVQGKVKVDHIRHAAEVNSTRDSRLAILIFLQFRLNR